MGIGPLVAWRRASLRSLGRDVRLAGRRRARRRARPARARRGLVDPRPDRLHVLGLRARARSCSSSSAARAPAARSPAARGRGAFSSLVARNRRRYGGYIVHAAIVLLAIGIAGSSAYDTVGEGKLAPGQTLAVGDYRLTYRALSRSGRRANATEIRAVVDVERGRQDARHGRGRQERLHAPSGRSRTRSASAATSSPARTCS